MSPIGEARIGSPLAGGLLFLFLVLCVIGLILTVLGWVFGFDLTDVDVWLDAQAPWMDIAGTVLIQKVLMAIVLLFRLVLAVTIVFERDASGARKWGQTILALLGCLLVGYCSAVNVLAPLDVAR